MADPDQDTLRWIQKNPVVRHIRLSLAGDDRRAYGIMLEIKARTNRRVRLGGGTLFRAIKQLARARLDRGGRPAPRPGTG